MTVIQLDGIKHDKHRRAIKEISDIFDEYRGNIPDDIAFTKFDSNTHTILFNTKDPELNGTSLIPYDNDKLLFAPVTVKVGVCTDPQNNATVNLLFNKDNGKKRLWEGRSNTNTLRFLIQFKDESPIAGFSVMFGDSVRTKYRMGITLANDKSEVLSQVNGLESSWDSNNYQFFQFASTVEGVTKCQLDVELVGQNKNFEWKMHNISFYSAMNLDSLKNLNNLGIVNWTLAQNPIMMKDLKEDPLLKTIPSDEDKLDTPITEKIPLLLTNNATFEGDIDNFGTRLPFKVDTKREYFDSLSKEQIVGLSNVKRLYSITELPKTGQNVYTFETDSMTRHFELKFQPLQEQNKYGDQPVLDFDQLVEQGYMKKGGFKNYILTFYIKLDDITLMDQNLVWKYGGWLSNPNLPDHARFTDVFIPLGTGKPKIYTEYKYNLFKELNTGTYNTDIQENHIPEGKWVGFQFIRDVQDDRACSVTININIDALDELGNPQGEFIPFMTYDDVATDDHIANVWAGMAEYINVTGAKYVNLTGISLYEIEDN